eukprot:Nk52_evm1s1440 gene=Nk52_evmTU1s1440
MGDMNSSSCSSTLHDDYGFGDINVAHGGECRNDALNMEDMFIEESCKRPLFSCNSVCAAGVKRKFSHDHNNGGVLNSASSDVAEDYMLDLHAEFLAIRKTKEQEAVSVDSYSQISWPTYSAHGEPSLCASQNWGFCPDFNEDDLDAETDNEDLEWNNVYELDLEVNLVEDIEGETATGILFSDFSGEEEYHSMLTFEPPSLVCSREVSVAGTGATNSPVKHNEYMNIGLHAADLNSLQGESSALAGINWEDEFAVDVSVRNNLQNINLTI